MSIIKTDPFIMLALNMNILNFVVKIGLQCCYFIILNLSVIHMLSIIGVCHKCLNRNQLTFLSRTETLVNFRQFYSNLKESHLRLYMEADASLGSRVWTDIAINGIKYK